ncbi:AI-2E family transporter [uncultured Agrococcus sp.]|uniref:AI-2E family transporter n=1 Tax=uncultured Agrococcus sp. TaxID=382258 RepID=UPI0025DEFC39|nr:AI-2E family transporter [uncultured Agrococcus sp.]
MAGSRIRRRRAATGRRVAPDRDRASRWPLSNPFAFGFLFALGALAAIVLGLAVSNLSTVMISIVLALFAALGLDPLVVMLERRGISRALAIVIVYVSFALIIVGILLLIVPQVVRQIAQFFEDAPGLIADVQRADWFAWMQENLGDAMAGSVAQVHDFITNPGNIAAISGGVLQVGATIAQTVSGLVIVLVLSLYFLAALPRMKQSFYRLAPAYSRARVADLTEKITGSIGGYLMGMVILATLNALFVMVLHLALQLPFALLLTVLAFCITLIPLIGSVLFWAIASVLALFTSPVVALAFAIIYLLYMQLEAYWLTPRVMNRTVSVPGSLVVIGALVGGTLLGLLGALVAIPVTASLLLILNEVVIPKQDAKRRKRS